MVAWRDAHDATSPAAAAARSPTYSAGAKLAIPGTEPVRAEQEAGGGGVLVALQDAERGADPLDAQEPVERTHVPGGVLDTQDPWLPGESACRGRKDHVMSRLRDVVQQHGQGHGPQDRLDVTLLAQGGRLAVVRRARHHGVGSLRLGLPRSLDDRTRRRQHDADQDGRAAGGPPRSPGSPGGAAPSSATPLHRIRRARTVRCSRDRGHARSPAPAPHGPDGRTRSGRDQRRHDTGERRIPAPSGYHIVDLGVHGSSLRFGVRNVAGPISTSIVGAGRRTPAARRRARQRRPRAQRVPGSPGPCRDASGRGPVRRSPRPA